MKKKIIVTVLAVILVLGAMSTASFVQAEGYEVLSSLELTPVNQESITDSYGMQIMATTFAKGTPNNAPVAVYVINHNGEYPDTQTTDEEIVSWLLDEGYVVLVLDYQDNPLAVSPNIETSVQAIRISVIKNKTYMGGLSFNKNQTYVIPAGYKIARDIVYFEMATQSSQKGIDNFVNYWNNGTKTSRTSNNLHKNILNKLGSEYIIEETRVESGSNVTYYAVTDKARANTWQEIRMPDGSFMTAEDTQLKMDIIYPASPSKEVPVAVLASSGTPRNTSTVSTSHADRVQHTGFLFRGYATVCYDHEYYPYDNLDVGGWGHSEPSYTIQGFDGVKTHTAAIRCIKYHADEFGYSKTKIGVFGHSKSSFSALLTNPNSEKLIEDSGACPSIGLKAPYYLEYKDGTPINADITCAYHSMGNGSGRYKEYLTSSNVPTIICCGQKDSGNGCNYWEAEKAAYIRSGIEFLAIPMEDEGHTYPIGYDSVYDYDRYIAFCQFFDYYLKDTAPTLLYTSARDGQLKDLITTKNPIGSHTSCAKTEAWSIIEGETVFVQFVAPVTEWSFLEAVSLTDKNGNEVEGTWYAQGSGNKWIFDGTLVEGQNYTLSVSDNTAKDKYGRAVKDGITVEFTK